MNWQDISIYIIVGAAILFLIYNFIKRRQRKKGCDKCPLTQMTKFPEPPKR